MVVKTVSFFKAAALQHKAQQVTWQLLYKHYIMDR